MPRRELTKKEKEGLKLKEKLSRDKIYVRNTIANFTSHLKYIEQELRIIEEVANANQEINAQKHSNFLNKEIAGLSFGKYLENHKITLDFKINTKDNLIEIYENFLNFLKDQGQELEEQYQNQEQEKEQREEFIKKLAKDMKSSEEGLKSSKEEDFDSHEELERIKSLIKSGDPENFLIQDISGLSFEKYLENHQIILDFETSTEDNIVEIYKTFSSFYKDRIQELERQNQDQALTENDIAEFAQVIEYIEKNLELSDLTDLDPIQKLKFINPGFGNLCDIPLSGNDVKDAATKIHENFLKFYRDQMIELERKNAELEKQAENFVFLDQSLSDFNQALEYGNLKILLELRTSFPNEYNNEIFYQKNFKKNLEEKFKNAFIKACVDGEKLKAFVETNIGKEIIEVFHKTGKNKEDKNETLTMEDFVSNIMKLDNKDSIFNILLDILNKLTSSIGITERKLKNTSKDKFCLNLVKATEEICFSNVKITKISENALNNVSQFAR